MYIHSSQILDTFSNEYVHLSLGYNIINIQYACKQEAYAAGLSATCSHALLLLHYLHYLSFFAAIFPNTKKEMYLHY